MKTLLSNQFAPTTFCYGFMENTLSTLTEAIIQWKQSNALPVESILLSGPISAMLPRLEPLTFPHRRELIVPTDSTWTCYFDNGTRGTDPFSTVSYMCQELRCRGLVIRCIPQTRRRKRGPGVNGAVVFNLFAPHKTDWLNYERSISVVNSGTEWKFDSFGSVQPFEECERYKATKVRERFTSEMLEQYCLALSIRLFDEGFYGPGGVLLEIQAPLPGDAPSLSYAEARVTLNLSSEQ